jgi:hypothetical protein
MTGCSEKSVIIFFIFREKHQLEFFPLIFDCTFYLDTIDVLTIAQIELAEIAHR